MLFELDDVALRRSGRLVLDRVSARIEPGATAIVGPSGSGKSSLLRLLNRLSDPDRGVVRYRGTDVRDLDVLELRCQVGLVPQQPAPIEGSVADNLAFAASFSGSRVDVRRLLELAGLDPGYAGRTALRLSVGEQQRVMLARALAAGPEVLLLDEPTSALDPEATAAVEQTLGGLRGEADLSLVLVTHDAAQAKRLADARIALEGGRVVAGEATTA